MNSLYKDVFPFQKKFKTQNEHQRKRPLQDENERERFNDQGIADYS